MLHGEHIAAAVTVSVCLLIIIVALILRCSRRSTERVSSVTKLQKTESFQTGIEELHRQNIQNQKLEFNWSRRSNYGNVFPKEQPSNSLFNWADHPSLVADAVENGWSRFAFIGQYSSSLASSRSNRAAAAILGSCAAVVGDRGREKSLSDMESSWEIADGSSDFMQKIRFNPGLKTTFANHHLCVCSTVLPLPGPCLGNASASAFPQEAYFEVTVLWLSGEEDSTTTARDSEKAKLMDENHLYGKVKSESIVHSPAGGENRNFRESMTGDGFLTVGLSRVGGGYLSSKKVPGSFPGSIGFNVSNGSVYLDGNKQKFGNKGFNKLNFGRVFGCGYNPSKKEILFTIDSEVIHIINCKSDEYGSPLYPMLASDMDLSLQINLGQSNFSYAPANAKRNPNPCFMSPAVRGLDEDSKELFSMGRIDSQWHKRGSSKGVDYDTESEGEFFDIVIDTNKQGRSTN